MKRKRVNTTRKYPRKKRTLRSRRNKRFSRRRRTGSNSLSLRRNGLIIPDRMHLKLRFRSYTSYSLAANINLFYYANSAYSPDPATSATIFGENPWRTFYQMYTVTACKIKVTWINTGATEQCAEMTIIPSNTSSILGSSNPVLQPKAKSCTILGELQTSKSARSISNFSTIAAIMGVNKSQVRDLEEYSSVMTNNPTTLAYWILYISPFVGTTLNGTIYVEIEQYVTFFQRKNGFAITQ